MRDIGAALRKYTTLPGLIGLAVVVIAVMIVLHLYSLTNGGRGGGMRGTLGIGDLHLGGTKLHARLARNRAGGAPYARTAPAVQDIAGPEGGVKDEPFTGVVTPTPPSGWAVMPYPADYAAVDD